MRKSSEKKNSLLRRWVLFAFLFSVCANAVPSRAEDAARALFLSPEILGSFFVTDKGMWSSEDANGSTMSVHTGDYNFLFLPAVNAGYMKSPWSLALRYAYPVQLARLNLPYDKTAEGYIRGTELGGEFAYAFKESGASRFYGFSDVSMKVSGTAELDVRRNGRTEDSPSFEPDRAMRNYTFLLGAGYDFLSASHFSYGFKLALLYSSLDMTAEPRESEEDGGEERLELHLFSVLGGIRVRFDVPLR